jgi:zinc transport system substrate-binding protein
MASEVGGAEVETQWLVEQGQSLETLAPNDEIMQRIRRADLVIANGAAEEWAVSGFDDAVHANSVIRLDNLKSAASAEGARQLWLDPAVARELAVVIAERLSLKRPAQSAVFRQNAERFSKDVESITQEFAPKSGRLWGRQVLVLSQDYLALSKSLGLVQLNPVSDSPLRLSDDELATLRKTAKSEPVAAMLVEASLPLAVQQDLSRRLGVPVIALDSLGTSAGVGRNSYLLILRYNLEQLSRLLS